MCATTPDDHESVILVNSMERIDVTDDDCCGHRKLSISELRDVMQKEGCDQEFYVNILCHLLDECVSYNDSQQVLIHCSSQLLTNAVYRF